VQGGCRGGFHGKTPEAVLVSDKASSCIWVPKAKPISDAGGTSVITYLRKSKKEELGGGGDVPGATAEIPLQPAEKITVTQVVPMQTTEVNGGAAILLQPMEDATLQQVDVP